VGLLHFWFRYFRNPLSRAEAEKMMRYRWRIASQQDTAPLPFTEKAIDDIYTYSKGVPRAMCQVADVSLLAAFNQHKLEVNETTVKMVVNSLSRQEGET
jgi:type II secretory pathway predicted ATPase ExeA